jgi:hypothetical protein
MSKVTTFEQVRAGIAHYGALATLVTIGDDGRPHVVTSLVDIDGERLVVGAGSRSRANVEQRPVLTLIWHPRPDDEYLLIVDANVDAIDAPDDRGVSRVVLTVDGGIQHRIAGLDPGASTCRPVDARSAAQ